MSVYNGARYLRDAISSILAQSYTDFEFIIIDDGSTDETVSIIESYSDERIKLIRSDSNRGLASSLNLGIESARGEFIARQDADDISMPSRLEVQVSKMRAARVPTVVGGNWSIIDLGGREVAVKRLPTSPREVRANLIERNIRFPHGSMMFSRESVGEVGPYDTDFIYSQDLELQLRYADAGYEICAVDEVVYGYRVLPQQAGAKALLQSKFRETANSRFRTNDWSLSVSPEVIQAARDWTAGQGNSQQDETSSYWYALALISARGFRLISALDYTGKCVKSGNPNTITKLLIKLPLNLFVNSWATLEGRQTR